MKLHGVINASPDSLADFSIAETVEAARTRAELLIEQGCVGIDLGGAGSTQFAERVELEQEWDRLDGKIQTIAELGVELSVDTWQPEIMERALDAGANFMNAADGLQNPDMVALAADRGVPVVLPFLSGLGVNAMAATRARADFRRRHVRPVLDRPRLWRRLDQRRLQIRSPQKLMRPAAVAPHSATTTGPSSGNCQRSRSSRDRPALSTVLLVYAMGEALLLHHCYGIMERTCIVLIAKAFSV